MCETIEIMTVSVFCVVQLGTSFLSLEMLSETEREAREFCCGQHHFGRPWGMRTVCVLCVLESGGSDRVRAFGIT